MNVNCPPEEQLLPLAAGESGSVEVLEHTQQCEDCQKHLERLRGEISQLRSLSFAPPIGISSKTSPSPAVTLLPNATTIGRYVIVASLGSGGQADVYRVVDPDLGRYLVLKLSHLNADGDDKRRGVLQAEGQLLADLDHPGLIRIFDVGLHQGRPYLVLEHVPGRNLEQIFADKRCEPRDAARLMAEVSQVVAYAHSRGVVHGDITPRNILIDSERRARLIDFGLSNIENAWGDKAIVVGGTPGFLPPEIATADGQMQRAAAASDVFGLGATLYWLLTGKAPFAASTAEASLDRSRRCDIDFAALKRAAISKRLTRICQQSLAANPVDRPTAEKLAVELKRASVQWISPRGVTAVAAVVLVCLSLFLVMHDSADRPTGETATVLHGTPTVSVFRRDGVRLLSNELPLRSGDRIAFSCNISQGHQATFVWLTAAGEIKSLTPERDVNDRLDRLIYPGPRRSLVLEPPEGTEILFICRGSSINADDLRACFPSDAKIPTLPSHNWLTLLRSEVKIEGPLKSEIPDEILKIETIMKEINRKLREHFFSVTGIAFPHREAAAVNN